MMRETLFVKTEITTQWLSDAGLILCVFTAGLLVCNQVGALSVLSPYYRINTPALCLLFGFVTACCSMRFAIAGCVFALPLLPTIAWQLQTYTGYGRVQDVAGAGLDLTAGVLLGLCVNSLWRRQSLKGRLAMPWPAGLVMVILTISVAVAIARNLHQSASPFLPQALLYNLMHLRTLGWHDDYRPLLDWAAYGAAFLLFALFIPALKAMPDRNDVIFKPLMIGLLIAALVGLRQSLFGAGLNISQITFRQGGFGYMALGFQPDLHAFGAHMLLGVVGLFGYLYNKKNFWLRACVVIGVMPLCGLVLLFSKSKSSVAVAVFVLLAMATLWIFRRAKYFKHAVFGTCLLSIVLILSFAIFTESWLALLSFILAKFSLPDLGTLNLQLSYRPEVYLAAVRMFSLFPFAGLGQAEFYRQSANHDLTNSLFLSYEQNGEHAHNYFLQTLVENGALGFAAFALLVAYPLLHAANKRALLPGLVALLTVFGGNLFSHSMLVRENLLLAAGFLALMYAAMADRQTSVTPGKSLPLPAACGFSHILNKLTTWRARPKVLVSFAVLAALLVAKETYQSFKSSPFNVDLQCQETRRLELDGWTSGRYVWDMPAGAQGMALNLATTQPDVVNRPLPASLAVWYDQRLLLKTDLQFTKTGPQRFEINLPEGTLASPDDYQIELKVQRCFVPRNFGMGGDARRLGVRVESVDWK
jgi:O-antigen ligase